MSRTASTRLTLNSCKHFRSRNEFACDRRVACTNLRHEIAIDAKYIGFTIPNHFVVGYGLDVGELYRNLPFIAVPEEPENLLKN